MRSSTPVWLLLISIAFLLSGCASRGTIKEAAICEVVRDTFSRKMDFQPLYAQQSNACRAVNVSELQAAGNRELFSDAQCTTGVSFAGEPWQAFCENNVDGSDRAKHYIGNPDAWGDLDPTVSGHIETRWNLSQGATLHLATVNQTQDRKRPYMKRVEYLRVGGCALGMQVFKTDPNGQNLKPMLFIHGGGWKYRGVSATVGIGTAAPNLTDRGYVVFAPFYRLIGNSDGPQACRKAAGSDILDDIDAAFQWVFENGERYGMDARWAQEKKLSVMGQSAGGHLAAYLATYHPESVERGILLYPALDLGFFTAGIKPDGLFAGRFAKSQSLLFDFFPQPGVSDPTKLDLSDPQIIRNSFPEVVQPDPSGFPELYMIHGDKDTVVPVELTTRFCEALDPDEKPLDTAYPGGGLEKDCGPNRRLTVVAGANHMLDLRCLTGNIGELIDRLIPEASALCSAGSEKGSKEVREALEHAYSKF